MAVFSKSPPQLNTGNVNAYLASLDNYLRSMQESVDYAIGQLNKGLSDQASTLEAQGKEIDTMRGQIKALGDDYTALERRVKALEDRQN